MKATELRIGNYIESIYEQEIDRGNGIIEDVETSIILKVRGIDLDSNLIDGSCTFSLEEVDTDYQLERYNNLEPIPLTEEWLLNFGFEKYIHKVNTKEQYTSDVVFKIDVDKHDTITICLSKMFSMPMLKNKDGQHYYLRGIQYVHQLQNLYFALTGQELTIKQTV